MSINYGDIDQTKKPRKKYCKSLIDHKTLEGSSPEPTDAEAYEKRLHALAMQNRAPSVAKSAAAEMLERLKPRKEIQEQRLSADEVKKIADIYDRIFSDAPCPNCGHIEKVQ